FIDQYESFWGAALEDLEGRVAPIEPPPFTPVRQVLHENTDLRRVIPIDGNTVYNARDLMRSWPAGGPPECWRVKIGLGQSGVTEANGRAFTLAQDDNKRWAICMDPRTGQTLWKVAFPNAGCDSYGPMPTPLIDGDRFGRNDRLGRSDRVYVVPGRGHALVCLNAADGTEIWTGPKAAWFSTPMIVGDVLYANLAGPEPVAALNKLTGEIIWKAQPVPRGAPSPASPVYQIIDGIPQIVLVVGDGEISEVIGVSAASGELFWKYPCTSLWGLAPTPVAVGSRLFVCDGSSSRPFSAWLQMYVRDGKIRARQVSRSTRLQLNQVHTPAVFDGAVFGFSGRALQCTSAVDGSLIWQKQDDDWYSNRQLIIADGLIFASTTRGELVLLEATKTGYKELGRVKHGTDFGDRQQPTIANGRLYIRGSESIVCYRVGPEPAQNGR
ncbi:MAG TPA: PQQ-binding-like beta-propeller repeat protein, partial [Planctomycetota bacterium]|nr:PQQ-binding-like beta-propeller repeat protein [Planctomycetota bacterium]